MKTVKYNHILTLISVCLCDPEKPHPQFEFVRDETKRLGGASEAIYRCVSCKELSSIASYQGRNGVTFGPSAPEPKVAAASTNPTACQPITPIPTGTDVGRTAMFAFIINCTVLSYMHYCRTFRMMMLTPYSRTTYDGAMMELEIVSSAVLLQQIAWARDYLKQSQVANTIKGKLVFSADGCYLNRGFHSKYMTTTMFCRNIRLLVGVAHIIHGSVMKSPMEFFNYQYHGTATGAEAFAIELLINQLVLDNLLPHFFVLDGDCSLWAEISRLVGGLSKLVPCFNHWAKSLRKWVEEALMGKEPVNGAACSCEGRNHSRKGTGCGCAVKDEVSQGLYRLMFSAVTTAKDDAKLFAEIVQQYPQHAAGNHEKCTFHPKFVCDPDKCDKSCKIRACSCGDCDSDGPVECFGVPVEPACGSTLPYASKRAPLRCAKDIAVLENAVKKVQEIAIQLLIEEIGKLDTCANEHINKVIADTRGKGQHPSSHAYQAMTNIGLLKANQAHYVTARRADKFSADVAAKTDFIDDEWLWQYHVFKSLCIPLPRGELDAIKVEVNESIAAARSMGSEQFKGNRARQKQKRNRSAAARRAYDAELEYKSGDIFNDAKSHIAVAPNGVLVVYDVETPGWGRYYDTVMELSAKVIVYTTSGEGRDRRTVFETVATFTGTSKVQPRNPVAWSAMGVKLRPEVLRQIVYEATSEDAMVKQFKSFLETNLPKYAALDKPAYLVAHNGFYCDAAHLELALNRASIDSSDLFSKLHIRGMIDTKILSKTLAWDEWLSRAVVPTTGSAVPHSDPVAISSDCDAHGTPTTPLCVSLDHLATNSSFAQSQRVAAEAYKQVMQQRDKLIAEIAENKKVKEKVSENKLSHSQAEIYKRLFDREPDDAHQALADVNALTQIVQHPLFWSKVCGSQTHAVSWSALKTDTHNSWVGHLHTVWGWKLQDSPTCPHGPMKPELVPIVEQSKLSPTAEASAPVSASTLSHVPTLPVPVSLSPQRPAATSTAAGPSSSVNKDSEAAKAPSVSASGDWKQGQHVRFSCVLSNPNHIAECAVRYHGPHESFNPFATVKKKKKVSKKNGNTIAPTKNGEAGSCTCKSKCLRGSACPCRFTGITCTAACTHGHKIGSKAKVVCENHTGALTGATSPSTAVTDTICVLTV